MQAQHVLVVEGDAALRTALARYLTRHGYTVSVAGSLAEARAHLAASVPDAVILSLELPDGTGEVLLPDVSVPVIALSIGDRMHPPEEATVAAYLRKPFAFPALGQALGAVLREAGSRKA